MYGFHISELQNEEINAKKIIVVKRTTYADAKRKPEKIQACRDSKNQTSVIPQVMHICYGNIMH